MLPNISLINGLEKTADYLEKNSANYNWNSMTECNIGLLGRVGLGVDLSNAYKEMNSLAGRTWSEQFQNIVNTKPTCCFYDNTYISYVMFKLSEYGIQTVQDYERIEFLGLMTFEEFNQSHTNKSGKKGDLVDTDTFANPIEVANSFRLLAAELRAKLVPTPTPSKKCIGVSVGV